MTNAARPLSRRTPARDSVAVRGRRPGGPSADPLVDGGRARRRRLGGRLAQHRPARSRPDHGCVADPAAMDRRRLLRGVRRSALARRCARRPVRTQAHAHRRVGRVRRGVRAGRGGNRPELPDRLSGGCRCGRGIGDAVDVVDHHQCIPTRGPLEGGRHVGGSGRRGRDGRSGPVRVPVGGGQLAVGLRGQRGVGGRRAGDRPRLGTGVDRRPQGRGRSGRRRAVCRWPVRGDLRHDRGVAPGVDGRARPRRLPGGRRRAGELRRVGARTTGAAARSPAVPQSSVRQRQPVDRRPVPDVLRLRVRRPAVPPARPRLLAVAGGLRAAPVGGGVRRDVAAGRTTTDATPRCLGDRLRRSGDRGRRLRRAGDARRAEQLLVRADRAARPRPRYGPGQHPGDDRDRQLTPRRQARGRVGGQRRRP